jgi:hypothetical protein
MKAPSGGSRKSGPLGPDFLLFCAAMRAVVEILLKSLAATVAADCLQIRSGRINLAGFVGDMTALNPQSAVLQSTISLEA